MTVELKPASALVLICGDLKASLGDPGLKGLTSWLASHREGARVLVVESLCNQPKAVGAALEANSVRRLILGVCSEAQAEMEIQTFARREGIDPLGIQVVALSREAGEGLPAGAAGLLLAAAVDRARAFPGSHPENLKPVLASSQESLSRRALFRLPPVSYASTPTIDRSLCTADDGCGQCVSACPLGAVTRRDGTVTADRAQCQTCGICVESCPQRAVELPGWSAAEVEAQLSALLDASAVIETRAIAFACKDALPHAASGWLTVRMPCAAAVPTSGILAALARGASAVGLSECAGSCIEGSRAIVAGRVDYCSELLEMLGDPVGRERVRLLSPREGQVDPAPALPPLPGEPLRTPAVIFGRGAAADAVRELAARFGATELVLDHPSSPLGLAYISEQACTGCGTCAGTCPTGALSLDGDDDVTRLVFDASLCTGCGACVSLCPERDASAIRVASSTDLGRLAEPPAVVFETREARCERCDAPVAPHRMLERISAILGEDYDPEHMGRLCMNCRGF